MNLLFDTHTMLWAMHHPQNLSATARTLIGDPSNTLLVSIASLWEITIKIGTGKIVVPGSDIDSILQNLDSFRIQTIPIRASHLRALQGLPLHHKDPFDRILIAQSKAKHLPLLTVDREIRQYQVDTIW